MLPTGLDGKPWPADKANAVVQRLKIDAIDSFYERDRDRTASVLMLQHSNWTEKQIAEEMTRLGWNDDLKRRGRTSRFYRTEKNGVKVEIDPPAPGETLPPNIERVVDFQLGQALCSGEETTIEFRKKYAEFLSAPRDHASIAYVPVYTVDDPMGKNRRYRGVAATVPWGNAKPHAVQSATDAITTKRLGRPPKQAVAV